MIDKNKIKYNILVTGTSSYGVGEGIIKAISESRYKENINLYGASNSNLTAYKKILKEYFILPNANTNEYFDQLSKVIKDKNINILIPGSEAEMVILSKIKDKLEEEYQIDIWVNHYEIISKFDDKKEAESFFIENDFSTPKSYEDYKGGKTLIKPVKGKSSEGIFIVDNSNQFEAVKNLYSAYGKDIICQEYIDAVKEYTISLIFTKDEPEILIMERLLNKGATQYSKIVDDSKLEGIIKRLYGILSSSLILNIQVMQRGNEYFIIEINPRFSGSAPMRSKLGFNEFDIIFSERIMGKKHKYQLEKEKVCIRGYWEEKE